MTDHSRDGAGGHTPVGGKRLAEYALSPTNVTPPSKNPRSESKNPRSDFIDDMIRVFEDDRFTKLLERVVSEAVKVKLEVLENKVITVQQTNRTLQNKVNEMQTKLDSIEEHLDDLQQYGRRNCLRLHTNISEDRGEDTDQIVLNAVTKLGIQVKLQDISRSHRVGRKSNNKPTPIIFRLISYRTRREIYQNRKKLVAGQFIAEDLTARRSHLLFLCRQLRRSGVLQWVWTSDGRILVKEPGVNAQTLEINRAGDLARFGAAPPERMPSTPEASGDEQ